MVFEDNLVLNGSATNLTNWTITPTGSVSVSSANNIFAGNYFLMASTAQMRQQINLLRADINTAQRPYRFQAAYFLGSGFDITTMESRAQVRLEFNYNDGSIDNFVFPLIEGYTPHVVGANRWHNITGWAYAKENAILNNITMYIITKDVGAQVGITGIAIQRSITELEDHNQDDHPHELPLAISVGSYGIKATKGTDVKFWLKDTGDAIFAGDLSAATGTFAGELVAATGTFKGALQAASGTFAGSLQAVDGTFRGSLTAATGTFAGDLSAAGGTFRGNLQAAGGTFTGALSAATGTFAGDLSAAGGTFRGSLTAATGTFAGSLQAASGTFTGALSAATGTFAGSLQAATGSFAGDISAASGNFRGTVYADKISTAYGQITNAQIGSLEANKITTSYGRLTTAQIENLVVGNNVTMGPNAYISWNQVTGAQAVTNKLTYIDAYGIYTGSLRADQITAGTISGDRIYGGTIQGITIQGGTMRAGRYYNTSGTAYMEMGSSSYGDMTVWGSGSNRVFQVYDNVGSASIRLYGREVLTGSSYGATASGTWNFTSTPTVNGKRVLTE